MNSHPFIAIQRRRPPAQPLRRARQRPPRAPPPQQPPAPWPCRQAAPQCAVWAACARGFTRSPMGAENWGFAEAQALTANSGPAHLRGLSNFEARTPRCRSTTTHSLLGCCVGPRSEATGRVVTSKLSTTGLPTRPSGRHHAAPPPGICHPRLYRLPGATHISPPAAGCFKSASEIIVPRPRVRTRGRVSRRCTAPREAASGAAHIK